MTAGCKQQDRNDEQAHIVQSNLKNNGEQDEVQKSGKEVNVIDHLIELFEGTTTIPAREVRVLYSDISDLHTIEVDIAKENKHFESLSIKRPEVESSEGKTGKFNTTFINKLLNHKMKKKIFKDKRSKIRDKPFRHVNIQTKKESLQTKVVKIKEVRPSVYLSETLSLYYPSLSSPGFPINLGKNKAGMHSEHLDYLINTFYDEKRSPNTDAIGQLFDYHKTLTGISYKCDNLDNFQQGLMKYCNSLMQFFKKYPKWS